LEEWLSITFCSGLFVACSSPIIITTLWHLSSVCLITFSPERTRSVMSWVEGILAGIEIPEPNKKEIFLKVEDGISF